MHCDPDPFWTHEDILDTRHLNRKMTKRRNLCDGHFLQEHFLTDYCAFSNVGTGQTTGAYSFTHPTAFWVRGSHGCDYQQYYHLGCDAV
jgi:hypothetical protein